MDTLHCNTCSSEKGSSLNGFPKKLLVAISVVLIITMCLSPTEARHLEHKRRHQKKTLGETAPKPTKESNLLVRGTRRLKNDLYTILARKIIKKLKNAMRFFTDARREIPDSKENSYGNPRWLPKVNFNVIHKHSYDDLPSGRPMSAQKFAFVVPKLYKTLLQYKAIWERLQSVNIHHLDNYFLLNYTRKRNDLIKTTLAELQKFITEVEDDLEKANLPRPTININRMNLEHLLIDNVDTSKCLQQDTIAIRAYGKVLKKWYWELRCPDDSNDRLAAKCRNAERSLVMKRKRLIEAPKASRQRRHHKLRRDETH